MDKPNSYTIIGAKLALEAMNDKVIILEDDYKTGNECLACSGSGRTDETCKLCKGTGLEDAESHTKCRVCNISAIAGDTGTGKKPCPVCKGSGTSSGVITPDSVKRRPTSGIIQSVGPKVNELEFAVGDRVMYGSYSGYSITFKQGSVVRIMKDIDIICKLHGVGDFAEVIQ